ncbi:hypothetical protein GCM10010206_68420 [Streptomyces cinerochromogenes]|nr:hypothetical protein GCM10010206_68420 [Streptomyces cinerochromogenes]
MPLHTIRTPAKVTPPVTQPPARDPGCRGGHEPPEEAGPVGCAAWLMSVSFLPPPCRRGPPARGERAGTPSVGQAAAGRIGCCAVRVSRGGPAALGP